MNLSRFQDKNCVIFNFDFMVCDIPTIEGQTYGIKYLVKILKNNGWKVYINNGNRSDDVKYIENINLLIKYSFCNTPNTIKYFNNPDIDLVYGGINNKWVDYFMNKYKIYNYPFPETCKIPSKIIKRFIKDDYLKTIKKYIKENKRDIEYDQFIIKPLYSFSGVGIKYIDRKCKTEDINKLLEIKHFPYVIQPLIKNVSKFQNKINHIRVHVLVSCFLEDEKQEGGQEHLNPEEFDLFKKQDLPNIRKENVNMNIKDFDLFKSKDLPNIHKGDKQLNSKNFDLFGNQNHSRDQNNKSLKLKHLTNPKNKNYQINVSVYDKYFILTAKDSESLDSHGKSTDKFRSFENYYKDFEGHLDFGSIKNQINEIVKVFKSIIVDNFKTEKFNFVYEDRKSVYSLFAFDFMILKNGNIKVLEINYKVGTTFWKENKKEMKDFYLWMYNNGIKPLEN